jgi:hypothetical protein
VTCEPPSASRQSPVARDGLDEADAAHEPALGTVHSFEDGVAAGLGDVALYQRARIEVEVQRSASRSASTSPDALRSLLTGWGARLGRACAGATSRPWATNWRSRSLVVEVAAGTMSASGCSRRVGVPARRERPLAASG